MRKAKRVAHFRVFEGEDGQWYWALKSSNHEIIAQSEGYPTKAHARRGVLTVQRIVLATSQPNIVYA
jgi:uncharacterized protein YegP (UPF0339 family)